MCFCSPLSACAHPTQPHGPVPRRSAAAFVTGIVSGVGWQAMGSELCLLPCLDICPQLALRGDRSASILHPLSFVVPVSWAGTADVSGLGLLSPLSSPKHRLCFVSSLGKVLGYFDSLKNGWSLAGQHDHLVTQPCFPRVACSENKRAPSRNSL
ncbi:uncharacterized protein ACIB01_012480 [Guaruba guarouba]